MGNYQIDEIFKKIDYTHEPLEKGEYEYCEFSNCIFSGADISDINFTQCVFTDCDLSMADITNTLFKKAKFIKCKMLGLHFDHCSEFGFSVSFDGCILNNSSFYQRKMQKTKFKDTSLVEVDFVECDLTECFFEKCDFSGSLFERTNLQQADLRTSVNYTINPEVNIIKQAEFSYPGLLGLLKQYNIKVN